MSWYEFTGFKRLIQFADKFFHFNIEALVFFPFIIYEVDEPSECARRRQKIHLMQQLETFVIFYYIIYWLDYIYAYYHYRDFELSHMKVRFEQEAIRNTYMKHDKKLWGWFGYRISREP